MKLSPWHKGNVKPVHKGVYEKNVDRPGKYQYWDGKLWSPWNSTIAGAILNHRAYEKSSDQNSPWRGVVK